MNGRSKRKLNFKRFFAPGRQYVVELFGYISIKDASHGYTMEHDHISLGFSNTSITVTIIVVLLELGVLGWLV